MLSVYLQQRKGSPMKKILAILLSLVLLISAVGCGARTQSFRGSVVEIEKFGNVVLDIAPQELLDAGYEHGDLLSITADGVTFTAPFCTDYTDVDIGEYVLRDDGEKLILAVNAASFAELVGIAHGEALTDGSVIWTVTDGRTLSDIDVTIRMKEPGGYLTEYQAHRLHRTYDRADYVSDAVYANFRNIALGEMGTNALFRSSSPANNELSRAAYADALAKEAGIRTVLNLADSESELQVHLTAADSVSPYYKSLWEAGAVKPVGLGMNFSTEAFRESLGIGLRFLSQREGPYLIHCTEGKDRAGFVSALLESFMGASYEQVMADYMTTYENYYHLTPEDVQYEAVKESNFHAIMATFAGDDLTDYADVDLSAAARDYMLRCGLTETECDALYENLSRDYVLPLAA